MNMRKTSWIALAALLVAPAAARAQQNTQQSASAQSAQSSQATNAKPAAQEDALAAAARKAREQRKSAPKAAKVFTNDNLPTAGGISSVGEAPAQENSQETKSGTTTQAPAANNQAQWRARFAALHERLAQDQAELGVMQRELGQQQLQYYNGDPQKAVRDQSGGHPLGDEYDKKRSAIDAKQQQIKADQQAISDAEDALRRAGGDPGWAR
jgi:hypothetical protein